ncbi:bifunctional adenosylcobinamide kinase/adenosylcobinamide-phosphate guanylyltransferase [Moorella sp. Hama-1]|uniref:bifunctional adenosylcobinamide kinase/adenosylcobinamide-phosphate guanylyltransferase n=1 Tax=Moorella sp. Hama-1 TaxID=2138101 RepID=UPI001F290182|nr:bifunctional adenosylcobinamide kinase/adenosylcobinamide-phosphate guanylyltransferase [Moorella sp. Hama-1]BCV21175.1 adenosylcobinamide kinase/adenosylcobinamide phosphate guanyltransferase [Moorella sp. Hama-1]
MEERGPLIMITGGNRSGKSSLAEEMAARARGEVIYLATATVSDAEMAARVARHRRRRPASWRTVEAPLEVTAVVKREGQEATTLLVDSLGMWLTNLLGNYDGEEAGSQEQQEKIIEGIMVKVRELAAAAREARARVIVVTDEVGLGLVPPYPLGRLFRDLLGLANQELARQADAVYLVVAGLPVVLKDKGKPTFFPYGG